MDWFLYDNGLRHEHTSELRIKKSLWDCKIAVDVLLESVWDHIRVFGIEQEYSGSYKIIPDRIKAWKTT